MRTISPYYPRSWFNDIGRSKILKELLPKLPDVDGKLFITLTTDPKLFESPESAFDHSRDRIRRIMFELRHGVEWNGKVIQIDAPYFVKVEFHANDWAHFHIIFNTRRYLDGGLLNALWDYGRTEVKRIRNKKFHYLLKYVTKGCELPDWVKNKTRIRIIQPSRGFYIIKEKPEDEETSSDSDKEKPAPTKKKSVNETTIGDRLIRWKYSALVTEQSDSGKITRRTQVLERPFWEILDENLYDLAVEGTYLGNGTVILYYGSVFEIKNNKPKV